MRSYSLTHLGDHALLEGLSSLAAQDRITTADLLAHLAEVDARKLYVRAAYPSMFEYCVQALHMSEDTALKRIRAARIASQLPAILEALADGRLNLNAVLLLKPYLRAETADELLSAAAHKTRSEIELLLARRFPRPDRPDRIEAIADQLAARPVEDSAGTAATEPFGLEVAARPVQAVSQVAKVEPLSPQRFALKVTVGQETHDKLLYLKALLSHQIPSGNLAEILDRAFELAIAEIEKRKFAKTSRPRSGRARQAGGRYIPAHVKHRVWERDGGRCTFVSESGRHCVSNQRLEFDHVQPVARGGQSTLDNLRLRCHAHNQYQAERMFGAGFMEERRKIAAPRLERNGSIVDPAMNPDPAHARPRSIEVEGSETELSSPAGESRMDESALKRDVIKGLRGLGFRMEQAREAAELCNDDPDATLEHRLRVALSHFAPSRGVRREVGAWGKGTRACHEPGASTWFENDLASMSRGG